MVSFVQYQRHKLPFLVLLMEFKTATNHILLIFKLRVYKSRKRGTLELSRLINEIQIRKLSPKSYKETGLNGRKLTEQERYNILLK